MQLPQLDSLYRELILDHYRSPRGRAPLDKEDVHNHGYNPVCGDEVQVGLQFDGDRIRSVQVVTRGCSISVASGSMLAELLPGKSRAEVEALSQAFLKMMHGEAPPETLEIGDLEALEGVCKFPVRVKCALLAWMTLRDALRAWDDGRSEPVAASTTEESGEVTA
ncbi:MAG TPA: SUF system NifU family Fe-S cluster assembly protein [Acidobacteriota bacterium]|jgi:nitrogen fixation NifU-like protein